MGHGNTDVRLNKNWFSASEMVSISAIMKKIILTVSLAAFVAAAFAVETTPAEKSQPACTNKANASCPMHGKDKEKAGCCEKKPQGECPFKKAEAEKKAADANKK